VLLVAGKPAGERPCGRSSSRADGSGL